ncbi:hypothetical protein FRB90_011006 [Tulasnella sp. 427]|nr:hypothetical protein FRB90_011006 [Tulasnella sp. 427]
MEHSAEQWFDPQNMAKVQKNGLVLTCPNSITADSDARQGFDSEGRNLYYIMRQQTGQPDLDSVMEDKTLEVNPINRTNYWITNLHTKGTFITFVSKRWQEIDTRSGAPGTLPRNPYSPQNHTSATSTLPDPRLNNYTMATWPNPQNLKYSSLPDAGCYRLAPLNAFDENDVPFGRINFPTKLHPGTFVVVDTMTAL